MQVDPKYDLSLPIAWPLKKSTWTMMFLEVDTKDVVEVEDYDNNLEGGGSEEEEEEEALGEEDMVGDETKKIDSKVKNYTRSKKMEPQTTT